MSRLSNKLTPYYDKNGITIYWGNCLEVMPGLEPGFHSVVTDPPYGLNFMGKHWDKGVPGQAFWELTNFLLLPGAYQLTFGGTRTFHRLAVAIEDAGFEIRDMIAWVYGSGFPKSLDVSKAIDKAAGAEREVVGKTTVVGTFKQKKQIEQGYRPDNGSDGYKGEREGAFITTPSTPEAQQWDGWGTALKPALEPISVARKPLAEKTVAANVLKYGTGGINIDGCRIGTDEIKTNAKVKGESFTSVGNSQGFNGCNAATHQGRFPANLIIDDSEEVAALFPETGGETRTKKIAQKGRGQGSIFEDYGEEKHNTPSYPAFSGSASRFFYCAKASQSERGNGNNHPTVKPIALMKYLIMLVTPPDGILLDPFMGSGTTLRAAQDLGFRAVGIELSEEDCKTTIERLRQPSFFSLPSIKVVQPAYKQAKLLTTG